MKITLKAIHAIKREVRDARRTKPTESQRRGGAIGEQRVIEELARLPDEYTLFNNIRISFGGFIKHGPSNTYIKSCQIDHVVLGFNGIFLIETKNWSEQ
jgi:hypothetical protein